MGNLKVSVKLWSSNYVVYRVYLILLIYEWNYLLIVLLYAMFVN